jgi:6-phosphogluconolactonase
VPAAEKSKSETNLCLVYFGTYTGNKSRGIYVSKLNLVSGAMTQPTLVGETKNPSFLAIHPGKGFLYAVGEIDNFDGKKTGALSAFALDPESGQLTLLNQQPSSGAGPCFVTVDKAGKHVLVANYAGGSIAALAIGDDGKLGKTTAAIQHTGSSVNPKRQSEPHAHSINLDAANRFAFAADLGLDKVLIYKFDSAKGTLVPNDPAFGAVQPGSGPRHFAFHPSGRFAFVINEILCTVTAFSYDAARGELKELQTISTLPPGESVKAGFSTAEVQVHPGGKFLYGSNRGHDTIAVFTIDEKSGRLTYVENTPTQGKTPRNFGIDPSGRILLAANQASDNVAAFRIDPQSGRLTPTGHSVLVGSPVCVKFLMK